MQSHCSSRSQRLYAVLLTVLCERWLRPDGGFLQVGRLAAFVPLILWLPLAPAVLIVALAWFVVETLRRQSATRALVENPLVPWLARLGLTVVFTLSLVELVGDTAVLT